MGYSDNMQDSIQGRYVTDIQITKTELNTITVNFDDASGECTAEFNEQDLDTFISKLQEARKAIT